MTELAIYHAKLDGTRMVKSQMDEVANLRRDVSPYLKNQWPGQMGPQVQTYYKATHLRAAGSDF